MHLIFLNCLIFEHPYEKDNIMNIDNRTYALALISLGHVMYANDIEAHEAWSTKYELDHVRYLTDNDVDALVVQELLKFTAAELFRRC